ncbi:MAG: VOC family protein [Burkholderiales bacterium]
MLKSSRIKPFLWFDHQAEEAAKFYASIFPDSEIVQVVRYPAGAPVPAGKADPAIAERVMQVLMPMVKLDLAAIEAAAR